MRLKKLEWKNIGPYGNKIQSMDFDEEGGLWMVLGKNGHGKSFTVGLSKILYYGKLDKLKKEDIANRLNRHGWIRGEIETRPGTSVTIERRIAPSELKVEKNGEDIGKALSGGYQEYIDQEVIGLPYHIFSNIISLSVNDFKSFVSMTPYDKRIIIDKLFSMDIINKMNELVRKDLREARMNMDLFDREIVSLRSSIEHAQNEFKKLREKIETDNTKRVKEITEKLMAYKPKIDEAKERMGEFQQKEADIKRANQVFYQQKAKLETEMTELRRKEGLYNQDVCPTCETPFDDKRFELIRGDLGEKLKAKKRELEDLLENETKYANTLNVINESSKKIREFLIQAKSTYTTLYNELQSLKESKPKELDSIKSIISKNTTVIKKKEQNKTEIDQEVKYLSILEDLYSDSGVKKRVLESYLPTLNKEVEYTLSELHFPYRLVFDNDFEPKLQHLGFNINVETLSTGEKKRVDLAVLISIIRMLKRKYPTLNIFMLDEVLSSIDGDGIYDIIGLLKKTAKELAMNIFIINHSTLPIEYFDYKMEITKNDGFSDLYVESLS